VQIGEPTGKCDSTSATSSLYVMQTSLGVNYDGSHWFHVAENFMAQHSVVRCVCYDLSRLLTVFDHDDC
jgi:hypothetical protein